MTDAGFPPSRSRRPGVQCGHEDGDGAPPGGRRSSPAPGPGRGRAREGREEGGRGGEGGRPRRPRGRGHRARRTPAPPVADGGGVVRPGRGPRPSAPGGREGRVGIDDVGADRPRPLHLEGLRAPPGRGAGAERLRLAPGGVRPAPGGPDGPEGTPAEAIGVPDVRPLPRPPGAGRPAPRSGDPRDGPGIVEGGRERAAEEGQGPARPPHRGAGALLDGAAGPPPRRGPGGERRLRVQHRRGLRRDRPGQARLRGPLQHPVRAPRSQGGADERDPHGSVDLAPGSPPSSRVPGTERAQGTQGG